MSVEEEAQGRRRSPSSDENAAAAGLMFVMPISAPGMKPQKAVVAMRSPRYFRTHQCSSQDALKRNNATRGWCGPHKSCLQLRNELRFRLLPSSSSLRDAKTQIRGSQRGWRELLLAPRHCCSPQPVYTASNTPDVSWRCVNNPIKCSPSSAKSQAGEGRCVLLCHSWATSQHAKATSLQLTRSPSSSPEGSGAGLRQ